MREIDFSKLVVIIDFGLNFISLETANHKLIASGEYDIKHKIKDMYISDFRVWHDYQGKGYGAFLARVFIDLARLYHLNSLSLTDGSTLEGFWQRLGFKWNSHRRHWVLEL